MGKVSFSSSAVAGDVQVLFFSVSKAAYHVAANFGLLGQECCRLGRLKLN